MSDFLKTLPLTKSFLEGYQSQQSTHFPGGGKVHYDSVLQSTHDYLNEEIHKTVEQRAAIENHGVYLTDHGPKHIELVLSRASNLVRTAQCIKDEDAGNPILPLTLKQVEQLQLELVRMKNFHLSDRKHDNELRYYRGQMRQLVRAALKFQQPIAM